MLRQLLTGQPFIFSPQRQAALFECPNLQQRCVRLATTRNCTNNTASRMKCESTHTPRHGDREYTDNATVLKVGRVVRLPVRVRSEYSEQRNNTPSGSQNPILTPPPFHRPSSPVDATQERRLSSSSLRTTVARPTPSLTPSSPASSDTRNKSPAACPRPARQSAAR